MRVGVLATGVVLALVPSRATSGVATQAEARAATELRVGETMPIEGTGASVLFEGVPNDSRCPRDSRCVRAGEAVVILRLLEEGREATVLTFRVPPGGGGVQEIGGSRIEILRLDPQAETEVEIAPDDYVVTLRAGRL